MYNNPFNDELADHSTIITDENSEKLILGDSAMTLKLTSAITNDQLGIYEINLAPKTTGAELHYHRFMDETFIILKGSVTVTLGSETKQINEGTIIHVPRFTPHAFKNESDQFCKLLLIFNPAMKREGFFGELVEILQNKTMDKDRFNLLYQKYDSYPLEKASI